MCYNYTYSTSIFNTVIPVLTGGKLSAQGNSVASQQLPHPQTPAVSVVQGQGYIYDVIIAHTSYCLYSYCK